MSPICEAGSALGTYCVCSSPVERARGSLCQRHTLSGGGHFHKLFKVLVSRYLIYIKKMERAGV